MSCWYGNVQHLWLVRSADSRATSARLSASRLANPHLTICHLFWLYIQLFVQQSVTFIYPRPVYIWSEQRTAPSLLQYLSEKQQSWLECDFVFSPEPVEGESYVADMFSFRFRLNLEYPDWGQQNSCLYRQFLCERWQREIPIKYLPCGAV